METSNAEERTFPREGAPSEIAQRLETYGALVAECNRYAQLERNAEEQRHTVRPHIYERVKKEYTERREALEQERAEQEAQLRAELEEVLERRRVLNQRCRQESDRLEELDFRVRVGEFQEEKVQETRKELKEQLLEITVALAEAQDLVNKFDQVGLFSRAPEPPPADQGERGAEKTPRDREAFVVLDEHPSQGPEEAPVVTCPPDWASLPDIGQGPGPGPSAEGAREPSVFGYLVALDGSRQGERFPLLASEMTVGSSPDIDIQLADAGIARLHARIVYEDGRHYIETVEAPGSCFVNGVRTDKAELRDGDVLSLGRIKMQVEYAPEANA